MTGIWLVRKSHGRINKDGSWTTNYVFPLTAHYTLESAQRSLGAHQRKYQDHGWSFYGKSDILVNPNNVGAIRFWTYKVPLKESPLEALANAAE